MSTDSRPLTVVGGGLGGLVSAITAAERGASVRLHEAHHALGGRWRATSSPYVLHEGPHVVYRDGPIVPWLRERGLLGELIKVPVPALTRFYFRAGGRLRHLPPLPLVRVLGRRIANAPRDRSYRSWASETFGEPGAELSAKASGVALFHPDPGELSAEFVWQRLRRAFGAPPAASYRRGAWGHMFDALADHARRLGVQIEVGSRITDVPSGPTIVATELESARVLLGDTSLEWPSGRTALLDLGLTHDRRDAFVVSDLDEAGWLETYSEPDPSLAPAGESVVQMQMPIATSESKADGVARLESLADLALPGWRDRVRHRTEAIASARTGAVDHPGTGWQDRPAIDRGDGVFLVGDRVAAPGLLSEVSFTSAVQAATMAVRRSGG